MKRSSKSRKNTLKRPLGFLRGEIWMSPDFDDPWELVETTEGRELRPDSSNATGEHKEKPKDD